jgi:hypothetical protein
MNGAREYAPLFKTGQYGRLFIASSRHARGYEFNVWVLPDGIEVPQGSYPGSAAVKVYGPLGGQLGWTEWYGWLHKGPWQDDFERLVAERRAAIASAEERQRQNNSLKAQERAAEQAAILTSYGTIPAAPSPETKE